MAGRTGGGNALAAATHNPFADLKAKLAAGKKP